LHSHYLPTCLQGGQGGIFSKKGGGYSKALPDHRLLNI